MRFIAQKRGDPFPMDVRRPLGLEKICDGQLQQRVAHWCGIEDIRVEQDRVMARMHATGDYSISDLAELFAVSRPTIYRTLQRTGAKISP
jgi:DNA-binding MarR family transcriptional regulator